MLQTQITTSSTANQSRQFGFVLKIAGTPIKRVIRQTIFVHCDLCTEQTHGTREELQNSGWGIYPKSVFCPHHEEMI